MKTDSSTIIYMKAICLICLSVRLLAAESAADNQLAIVAMQMRDDWKQIRNWSKGRAASRQAEMVMRLEARSRTSAMGAEFAIYLRSILEAKTEDLMQGATMKERTQQCDIFLLPEMIAILMENSSDSRKKRNVLSEDLARLLPITVWRSEQDAKKSMLHADVDPPPPIVPKIDREIIMHIGDEFERAGEWDLAWRAHVESIYGSYSPAWPSENIEEGTWVSEETAVYWERAAECAHKAGKAELGTNYLLKAAVFGGEKACGKVETISRKWSAAASETESRPIDEEVRRDALTKVVHLYAEINAHPRAFQLLDDYPEVFEDTQRLRKEIEEQWIAVVKDASRVAKKVTLYGTEVYPSGDPLKVRIPWAFSDEAVGSVRDRLKQ